MSAQHTPGPWIVHPLKSPCAYVIPVEHASRPVGGHTEPEIDLATYAQEICSVSCPDRHRSAGEMRANARLIAAAPDGLDAAQEALIALAAVPHSMAVQIANQKLRAFIAKATGSAA